MEFKRVVVTGIGTLNPLGNNIGEYAKNLKEGLSGCELIDRFDTTHFKTKFACLVKGFNPNNHFDRKEIRKHDLFSLYAMVAVEEAMKDAGFDLDKIDRTKAGVIFGSGIGGIETYFNEVKGYIEGNRIPRFSPFFIPRMISDIVAGHISMKYGFHGPNFGTVSACASSTNAIIDALMYIRFGKAKIFITGGSEAAINESGVGGFNSLQALSTNNENYKTASRPFDKTRDGFVMGEGSGVLVLEEYEHAKARGAKIYAECIGGGMSADAYHITAPHPDGLGAELVMKNALEDAGLKPEDIDYINLHGTATPVGDGPEANAVVKVFGEHAYKLNISSTKSMTGHLLGAAGAIESIASIIAMNQGFIPPTINHFEDDPGIDNRLNLTFNKAQYRDINCALSNTFGFGGHNASVIFKKIS
ncbi:MAG: beta-ketoacyl-ACP synthase II [Bacteroidales bacterium]|nr:beta-ketoacyl-ACP synthase II [Bacteroidales bacterium]